MTDGSSKADRARWVVPIAVALIGAIGAVIAAILASLPRGGDAPSTPPAPSITCRGENILCHARPQVDLDSLPNETAGDNVGDLIHTPMALTSSKDSLIALLDRAQPSRDVCRTALATRGTHAIPISQLENGVQLCITTTAGRTGTVTLKSVKKYGPAGRLRLGEVTFSYSVWS